MLVFDVQFKTLDSGCDHGDTGFLYSFISCFLNVYWQSFSLATLLWSLDFFSSSVNVLLTGVHHHLFFISFSHCLINGFWV